MKRAPLISVVMPALNEEANVGPAINNTLKAFDDLDIDGELIVVDDGSTDATGAVVREHMAKDDRVSLRCHDAPRGIGAAFWEGVDHARGPLVCMFPGDNENDPWESLRYIELLDQVDIVIPFVFNRQVRSLFRNGLSFAYRFIINTTFLVNFNYTNGTVIYRADVLKGLPFRSTGFFFQTDILVRLVKQGYLFAEVPYRLELRPEGISKAVTFPSFVRVVKGYLRLVRDTYGGDDAVALRRYVEGSQTARRKGAGGRRVGAERGAKGRP